MNREYITTAQLSERIHYDERTIRNRLNDSVLHEGIHYFRPFGGRKILYYWDAIERDMVKLHIPAQREHSIRNVNTESGETAKVFTLKPDSVFTFGRNGCSRSPEYAFCRCRGDSDRGLDAWVQ